MKISIFAGSLIAYMGTCYAQTAPLFEQGQTTAPHVEYVGSQKQELPQSQTVELSALQAQYDYHHRQFVDNWKKQLSVWVPGFTALLLSVFMILSKQYGLTCVGLIPAGICLYYAHRFKTQTMYHQVLRDELAKKIKEAERKAQVATAHS
jgi:hypothetical protein